jgi:hypothetical protein
MKFAATGITRFSLHHIHYQFLRLSSVVTTL